MRKCVHVFVVVNMRCKYALGESKSKLTGVYSAESAGPCLDSISAKQLAVRVCHSSHQGEVGMRRLVGDRAHVVVAGVASIQSARAGLRAFIASGASATVSKS